ncbi:MAG: ribonuclease HII [Sphingopyxis sp.]|nr:ribonuclease HII [Sphingopyxis sp.]
MADMIVGVDEAGRGPLAGPVVAAAVLLCDGGIAGLDDSKKLNETRRIALEAQIKTRCHWAIGMASVEEIDRINILQATMLAMIRAVDALVAELAQDAPDLPGNCAAAEAGAVADSAAMSSQNSGLRRSAMGVGMIEVLVDGNRLPKWRYTARAIVGGDALEPCISAASIIAKQHRDALMRAADAEHPGYGWASNKGYGSAAHLAALRALGPTPLHRRSFAPVAQHFFDL